MCEICIASVPIRTSRIRRPERSDERASEPISLTKMQFYAPAERLWKKISYLSGVGERYRGSDTLRWPEPSPQGPYHLLTGRVRGCDSHLFLVHQSKGEAEERSTMQLHRFATMQSAVRRCNSQPRAGGGSKLVCFERCSCDNATTQSRRCNDANPEIVSSA